MSIPTPNNTHVRIVGIDPGYDRCGIAIIEGKNIVFSTCIETDRTLSLSERIYTIGTTFAALIKEYQPHAAAIERLYFEKNQKSAMGVAEVRGVISYLCHHAAVPIYEYNPADVKIAITGYGRSDKKSIYHMLPQLIRHLPPHALDDEYDAIAIALTCQAHDGRALSSITFPHRK
jgi:crossover junction endodeoxyribonuclease RuvC